MDNIAKIRDGIEHCLQYNMHGNDCDKCSYSDECGTDAEPLLRDMLKLLESMEPVSPTVKETSLSKQYGNMYANRYCGECGAVLSCGQKYCAECGRAVKYDG